MKISHFYNLLASFCLYLNPMKKVYIHNPYYNPHIERGEDNLYVDLDG